MGCNNILLVADSTPFCDFPRKHVPARLAIFVAQLGRKFRLISLTVQRYESFIAVYEFSGEKISIFFLDSSLAAILSKSPLGEI